MGGISIHTLHAEGDRTRLGNDAAEILISIHTLHAEGDKNFLPLCRRTILFLSTPSMRRVTTLGCCGRAGRSNKFLSTPSMRRVTTHSFAGRLSE